MAAATALPGLAGGPLPGVYTLRALQGALPVLLFLEVLGQSRRSSLSGCQQCLSVTSSVLLSLFVSPIITAVTVGKHSWLWSGGHHSKVSLCMSETWGT